MKIFGFVKKVFFTGLTIISSFIIQFHWAQLRRIQLDWMQFHWIVLQWIIKARPETVNFNSYNPIFYPFSVKASTCSGNCNNINDAYAKTCVPGVVKDLNVKLFSLMWRTNETKSIKWHETCKYERRLDAIVRNNK